MDVRSFLYAFEGLGEDLPRPPMAALRALLSGGVLLSPRAWQALPMETRRAFAQLGVADLIDPDALAELLKQVPVGQVKFVGRGVEPSDSEVPPGLVTALGPARPLTIAEWRGLRPVDRYVLAGLVHNARLLWRARNEVLPHRSSSIPAPANTWSGAVARCEIHIKHAVLERVLHADFMEGRAFILASVTGRRAARRASELFDLQAESTVGPVEIDWGLRENEDVIFWQAHASAWDGSFFPAAALLAATSAAVAFYDMVRELDPDANVTLARIREEPWQAGRDELIEAPTGLFAKPEIVDAGRTLGAMSQTIVSAPPDMEIPRAPISSPQLFGSIKPPPSSGSRSPMSVRQPQSSRRGAPIAQPQKPGWIVVTIVASIAVVNLLALIAIVAFLAHMRR